MSYRKRKLDHEIKHIVEKELKKNIELKHFPVYNIVDGSSSPALEAPDGVCQDLSQIPQGDQQGQRDGDIIQAKTIRIRLQIQGQAPGGITTTWKDGCALVRIIIFTWIPDTQNTSFAPNAVTQILDLLPSYGSSPGSVILSPYLSQGQGIQFRVHSDETISLKPAAGSIDSAVPEHYTVSSCFFSESPLLYP